MEGLKQLKAGRPELALEHLTLAKSFDKKSSKIYVARGCALANLVIMQPTRITCQKGSNKSKKPYDYRPTTPKQPTTSRTSVKNSKSKEVRSSKWRKISLRRAPRRYA